MQPTALQESTAEKIQATHQKNLQFFKLKHPNIYSAFKDYTFSDITLNVDPHKDEIDIIKNGESLYQGAARKYAESEITDFKSVYSQGKPLNTLRPTFADDFPLPRFFHEKMRNLLSSSTLTKEDYNRDGYLLEDFYPMIIFCGVGSGHHIDRFLKNNTVQQVVIAETDLDHFAASLYTIDWEELYRPFDSEEGRSLTLLIGETDDPNQIFSLIWNRLIHFCPVFPLATLFYNHKANKKYEAPIAKICDEIRVFINLFGFYDDEINQLNNCLYNLHSGFGEIPPPSAQRIEKPVCIIGGGPSIDSRMETLKKYKDELTIISCGTGIRALYKNDIVPDIHIELESHLATLDHLINSIPREWLNEVSFIGASQVCPIVFEQFSKKRIYFKEESATSGIFSDDSKSIAQGTPSCTNAAVALATQQGCKKIYFFGLDFGFSDPKQHHSKHSIYFSKEAPDRWQYNSRHIENSDHFQIPGVDGSAVATTNNLFHGKRKVETVIGNSQNIDYYNCSDGANIDGAVWLSDKDFSQQIQSDKSKGLSPTLEEHLFSDHESAVLSSETLKDKTLEIGKAIIEIEEISKKAFASPSTNSEEYFKKIMIVTHYLENDFLKAHPQIYYFIRGSVWHLLYAGSSHLLAIRDQKNKLAFIKNWEGLFLETLKDLSAHFSDITSKDYKKTKNSDPWLKETIEGVDIKHYLS